MNNNTTTIKEIAKALRIIGSKKSIEKAKLIENETSPVRSLNLRSLDLDISNLEPLLNAINYKNESSGSTLKSISFSYNNNFGDSGVVALINVLPKSIKEIGLVNCGIRDIGGIALLNWIKKSPNLSMICIEQNNFSNKLKNEFENLKKKNPHLLIIF